MIKQIQIHASHQGLFMITNEVDAVVKQSGIKQGAFVPCSYNTPRPA